MSIEAIRSLPVAEIMAGNSALFLWATLPQLPEAFSVMDAWSFRYVTTAFVWLKQNRKPPGWDCWGNEVESDIDLTERTCANE